MNRPELSISELYSKYKADQSKLAGLRDQQPPSLIGRLLQRGGDVEEDVVLELQRDRRDLVRAIVGIPARHSFSELVFKPQPPSIGRFSYKIGYPLGEDVFSFAQGASNDTGLRVQKHPHGSTPEVEVFRMESSLLHVPEGLTIPVGPLRLEKDSRPMTQDEFDVVKAQALKKASDMGAWDPEEELDASWAKTMLSARKYTDRYFLWQPELPDVPRHIAIDFDNIEPYHMALVPQDAPTFAQTRIVK